MRAVTLCLLVLISTSTARAWNVTGHEIVAAEAYDLLAKEHPKTLAKILAVLRQHPLKELEAKQIAALNAPAGAEDKAIFLAAARFPDDVKLKAGIKGYNHPTWHYIDFPIARDGVSGPQPEVPNAIASLAGQAGVIKGNNPDADKAVAVCWIEHLVGDLHQPLHACSVYDTARPKGDRGGNNTYVRFGTGKTINLHALWDETLGKDSKFAPATRTASELLTRPEFALSKLPEATDLDPAHWAKESFDLAKRVAYLDNTLPAGEEKAGTVLPTNYGKVAKTTSERRVALAGYRLAAVLVSLFGEG